MLSLLTRSARLSSRVLLPPYQRPSVLAALVSHPSVVSTAPRLTMTHQPFSTSWIAFAKRTPRPKQRIVKEQKLKVARKVNLSKQVSVRADPRTESRPLTRKWRKLDTPDSIGTRREAVARSGSRSRSGFGLGL